ncbi:MAG: hypothetical protein KDA60_17900 [Planctomycetales bacterium]|nr:hypothetical protein [Planctomycetales bacterium]
MRFSIGHLLLVFPAFFLATFIAEWWDSQTLVTYRFTIALNEIRKIQFQLKWAHDLRDNSEITEDVVNQWLAGSLPDTHPAAHDLYESPGFDPWGSPYKCLPNVQLSNGVVQPFGVYSMGRDSESESNGNDPDDLNSWNEDCYQWYVNDITQRNRRRIGIYGAMITPVVYLGLFAAGRLFGFFRPPQIRA